MSNEIKLKDTFLIMILALAFSIGFIGGSYIAYEALITGCK